MTYLYQQEDLSIQSLYSRRIYNISIIQSGSVTKTLSSEKSVCRRNTSTAHGDGRGRWRNGDAAASGDAVPTAAPHAPAAAS